MSSSYIIAALAVFTIGSTLVLAIFHFGFHLKDPKNLEAAKRVAEDRESATTRNADNQGKPNKPLRQRLDEASGSANKEGWRMVESTPPHSERA